MEDAVDTLELLLILDRNSVVSLVVVLHGTAQHSAIGAKERTQSSTNVL